MKRVWAYLVVNGQSAWPIGIRHLGEKYLKGIYDWPGCIVVEELGPDWSLTENGNYIRAEIENTSL